MDANTTASNNTAIGKDALSQNQTASGNTAVGASAVVSNTTGGENTGMGFAALFSSTTGSNNTAVGYYALLGNTTGANNAAVGTNALQSCTTGIRNTAVGKNALASVTTSDTNTGLGFTAGSAIITGANNTCLGYQSGGSASPSGNLSTSDNNFVLGNNSVQNLFCADTSISSSDSRDKTDVESFNIGLAWIEALRPVTYRWDRRTWYGTDEEPFGTPDGSKKRQRLHIGFLAQEALEVEKANGYGSSNDDSLICNLTEDGMSYGMKYERLVPILVNAIKELSTKVTALEAG